jgi:hypothetical protein
MRRTQDILFGLLFLGLLVLLAFHVGVIVVALVGAFACGSVYLFAGMMPSANESFWQRIFTSVFLSVVVSSLILILPGTFGARFIRPDTQETVLAVAAFPPLAAICFEVLRTPRVARRIQRWLGHG